MSPVWNPEHLCQPQSLQNVLWGYSPDALVTAIQRRLEDVMQLGKPCPTLAIAEPDPLFFLAGLLAGLIRNAQVILANPQWGMTEWQQVFQTLQPDLVWGASPNVDAGSISPELAPLPKMDQSLILIPTGGTCGHLKFAVHTWATLSAAVQGFQDHFGLTQINTCCVLPLYHVSGLMQFVRSLLSGGKFLTVPFHNLESGQFPSINPADFWISLVPTQLQRLLTHQRQDWLCQFQGVLLGGAPAWSSLLQQAREARIPLALTYGMSETAAQVATLLPQDFLQGRDHCGRLLPHVACLFESDQNAVTEIGVRSPKKLRFKATSLALGHYTKSGFEPFPEAGFLTDDLGHMDAAGNLHIVGRDSHKIITGGENVFPADVEAAIYRTGLVKEVCVIGLEDQHWGQVVTAIYSPSSDEIGAEHLNAAIADQLARFKQPKHWIAVSALPKTPQGKVDIQALTAFIERIGKTEYSNPI
jgi:o-succinylbenzoate---CoA ligase